MSRKGVQWLAEYREANDLLFRIGREGDTRVAEWIGLVTVTSDADGRQVTFDAVPGADADDVEKIRRGGAMLLARHLQGKLAMHGAAVSLAGRAVVLLGRSGQGKSTLAASLCGAGASLLADDAVAIDPAPGGFVVVPTETKHWLDGAASRAIGGADAGSTSQGDKSGVGASRVAAASAPLCAFVELAFAPDGTAPRLVRLDAGLAAMATLIPQAVRFAVDDERLQRAELDALGRLVEHVPVYRLERPRALGQLSRTHSLLAALAEGRSEGGMERSS